MIFQAAATAIAAAPDSDQQKRRDERELVEGVKEKQIERRERADRAGGDEEKTGVKRVFVICRSCRRTRPRRAVTMPASSSMIRLKPSTPSGEVRARHSVRYGKRADELEAAVPVSNGRKQK